MFEALFGAEMPLAIRFCVAFLISLGLTGATAWAMLRFGTEWSGGASIHARAREPRLAVVDHASVDESRQLIIARCDNVEHLLMIGRRTDVVVEVNIVRAASTARSNAAARGVGAACYCGDRRRSRTKPLGVGPSHRSSVAQGWRAGN